MDTHQSKPPWERQTVGLVFKSDNAKAEESQAEPKPYLAGPNFVSGKAQVENKNCKACHGTESIS